MQNSCNYIAIILLISIANIVFEPFLINFNYVDECLVAILMIFILKHIYAFARVKEFRVYLFITLFFLVYSLIQHTNVPQATIRDFLIFFKPFICFYVGSMVGCDFSPKIKFFCKIILCIMGLYLWSILPYIGYIYRNTTAYYPACVFVCVGFIFFSVRKKRDWLIASILLVPGLASIRAKFFSEFIMWFSILFLVKRKVRINIKYVVLGLIVLYIGYYVNQEKIAEYFINGLRDDKARAVMYYTALLVLKDFFPFGPGFGTFATDSAAKFYSPLNYRYHLNHIWGLNINDIETGYNYYSDTFYPILAQFGVVGALLFFWFCKRRWTEGSLIESMSQYKIFLFMYSYIAIQCIAENTFTGPSSIPIMLIIGMCLSPKKRMITE